MIRRISCLLLTCLLLGQTVLAADNWHLSAIDPATEGADGSGIRVAIIDTGISTAAISSAQVAEGKNYIDSDAGTEDKIGHGTAVASILSGVEAKGLIGIAPGAILVPLVHYTVDANGEAVKGDRSIVSQAIRDAVDIFDCRVINISSGIASTDEELYNAVTYAENKGAVVVSAAGNDNNQAPDWVYYPAAYDTVLGVSALREDGVIASFSQRNSSVNLCAPGDGIKVATLRGKTATALGTSYASAFVSGAAAVLLSEHPELTPAQVRRILCASAKDIGAQGYEIDSGFGLIQLDTALDYAANGLRFRDVGAENWFCSAVRYVTDRELFGGTSFVEFNPGSSTTRGMLVTVLWRLEGVPAILPQQASAVSPFADVQSDAYYAKAVSWAAENKIVSGSGNGLFRPEDYITREQLAAILYRYAQYKGIDISGQADLTKFKDAGKISGYALTPVSWASAEGLMNGNNSIIDPDGSASRAQTAAILMRFCERIES